MGKFLITEWNHCILTAFYDGSRILTLDLSPINEEQILDNIYVARVERVVKNLNAAFLRYGEQERAYCSLDHPITPVFQNRTSDFTTPVTRLREGDVVLAQITQEAMKTKEPCASTDLCLAGRYVVLQMNAPKFLNFSKKIRDREFRREWEEFFAASGDNVTRTDVGAGFVTGIEEIFTDDGKEPATGNEVILTDTVKGTVTDTGENSADAGYESAVWNLRPSVSLPRFGFILRTNAVHTSKEDILTEMNALTLLFKDIVEQGRYRSLYSLVYQDPPAYLGQVRDACEADLDEVVTDLPEVYARMQEAFAIYPDLSKKLRLYQDSMLALSKLYPVEKTIREALGKRVWLKSGGYLLIEQTETCVVIDVNTGKFDARKEKEATFLKINLEAADEIALQLRLRNLSGMILVDFINMKDPEHDELLLQHLKAAVARDRVPVMVVDMTKLKLVELTRKKEKKTLAARYAELIEKNSMSD